MLIKLSQEILSGKEVNDILNNPKEFPLTLIEELSLATALEYWNRKITYSEADCIMNNLYIYWMITESHGKENWFSGIAWDCYLAFDAGEFFRDTDDRCVDPSEKYTRPLIEDLLKKQKLID